jgi:hypothetical protein
MTDGPRPKVHVLYVHGAGKQDSEQALKEAYDNALFAGKGPSAVARYADVFWGPRNPNDAVGPGESMLDAIASERISPRDSAEGVVDSVALAPGLESLFTDDDREDAINLASAFFARADELEAIADCARATELLPDFVFRRLAGFASHDVVAYLYKGWAAAMREPVTAALKDVADPLIVIAHSLGSIVTYDVLCRPEFAGRDIRLLITAGSPLGIDNVKRRLNDRKGPGKLPTAIAQWVNFADPEDLVVLLGYEIANEYIPPPSVRDEPEVNNPADNNHDLTGYLQGTALRVLVRQTMEDKTADSDGQTS